MMSLFQGTESIKVNTSLERAAEEEALEDQRRRNEELGNMLQNAFDDLEEDETTVDSTTHFPSDLLESNKHESNNDDNALQMPKQSVNGQENGHLQVAEAFEAELHQLKMLLESRTREMETFRQMTSKEQHNRDELQKRLCITEVELDRALATKKNTHELLVECKEKCSNLECTVAKVRAEKKALEAEHNAILSKLETSQTLLADIQRKYDMVERDRNQQHDRSAEQRRKQQEERHRAEIEMLQQQLEQLANKLDRRTSELESMNARYHGLQASHETMLVEKGSHINDLNNALSEAQRKCEELLSRPNYFQENVRLQKLVASQQQQMQSLEKTVAALNERLEFTTAELDVMDSVLQQHNLEDTPRRLSQTQGKVVGSTPLNTVDRVGNLKDELYRALANVKGKREEIRRLQQQLEERNAELRTLREEENKALVQLTTLRETNVRLEQRLKLLEEEYAELRHKAIEHGEQNAINNKQQTLEEKIQQLETEKRELWERHLELERTHNTQEADRRKLDTQLRNVEVDLEELKQEHESMKRNYEQILQENQQLRSRTTADAVQLELEKHKFLLKDAQAECDRLKNLYIEISNAKEALSYEVDKLRNRDGEKELHEAYEKMANLQRALHLAEVKSSELTKILETEKLCHEREMNALKQKCEKEKSNSMAKAVKDSSNNCTKCIDYMAEITKFEIQNLKLANVNSTSKKEIDDLTQQLKESNALIGELRDKLQLSEQQGVLIKELKAKASRFEEYIKSHHSSASEPSHPTSPKQHTSADDKRSDTELPKCEIRKIESRMRDEMAKLFASELKRLQIKLHQAEEKNDCLQREYQLISGELQQRQIEVELLKQAILAERERMGEILKQKDTSCKELVEKQNAMLLKCRDELKAKNQRVSLLCKELEERQVQIEAERRSMKAVMAQWEQQRKSADAIESEWKDKVQQLQQSYIDSLATWQKKYNSAKHTAVNYKRYAEDKEAHMLREYDRLKAEYDASLANIELRMKAALEKKTREMNNAATAIEKRHEMGFDKENIPNN